MEPFLGPQPWQRCQEHWSRSRREERLPNPPNPRKKETSAGSLETANPASLWLEVSHALLELAPGLYVLAQKSPCGKYLRGYSPLSSSSDLMEPFTLKPKFGPMGLQILHPPRNIPIFSDTMCNPWTLFSLSQLRVVNAQETSADPRLFQVSNSITTFYRLSPEIFVLTSSIEIFCVHSQLSFLFVLFCWCPVVLYFITANKFLKIIRIYFSLR